MRRDPSSRFLVFFSFSWPTKKKKLSHASDSSPNQLHFTTSNELCGFETRHRLGKKKTKQTKQKRHGVGRRRGFFCRFGWKRFFFSFRRSKRTVLYHGGTTLLLPYYILGRVIRYAATISRQIFPFVTHA